MKQIRSNELLEEFYKEYNINEFDLSDLDLFLKFIDDNCNIYLIDDFYKKGNKILENLNIKTKKLLTNEELKNNKNACAILIDRDESNKKIK